MEDLIRVLDKTASNLQADQNEAVKYIQDFTQRDFTGFLKAVSDVLFNQQNQPLVRAAAGLQLKNQLRARDDGLRQQQQDRWRSLPEETRTHIKERVFNTLGTEIFRPASAPQLVAYIAIVELPEGQWPHLIERLTTNIKDSDSTPQLRLASLEAIGYICQEIDQSCLQTSDSNRILSAIVGLKADETEDVKLAATTALVNLCDSRVQRISRLHQCISLDKLGEYLSLETSYAERVMAQLIREERIHGHISRGEVQFETKEILEVFDEEILRICSDINDIIEKIQDRVPKEWWAANAHQA